jgi:hypothetical protein
VGFHVGLGVGFHVGDGVGFQVGFQVGDCQDSVLATSETKKHNKIDRYITIFNAILLVTKPDPQ